MLGAPLVLIYLWITFGIGIRYGGRYLVFSAILNLLSFFTVVYFSSYWSSQEVLPFSIGLLISFVILPAYVFILIGLNNSSIYRKNQLIILVLLKHRLRQYRHLISDRNNKPLHEYYPATTRGYTV